jgi:hypothetical protein
MTNPDRPDRPDRPKRRLTARQLAYLAAKRRWTRIRLKAWDRMPDHMEACRRQATVEASRKKRQKNDAIRQAVAHWPATLTTHELREHIARDIEYAGKVTSLIWRMRRNGIITFALDGLWYVSRPPEPVAE